jgi:hypothetical protein
MPNHVENDLYVSGPKEDRKKFTDMIKVKTEKESYISILQTLFPCPEDLKNTPSVLGVGLDKETENKQKSNLEKYGYSDWYGWCNNNWGTKWGDYNTEIQREGKNTIKITFKSAWSPPIQGITKVSQIFPRLRFKLNHFESGSAVKGTFIVKGGIVQKNVQLPYSGRRGG